MKKNIPQNVLQPEQTSYHQSRSNNMIERAPSSPSHQPVVLEELISSIAERNYNAMQPSASQKAHNQRALSSVLRTIFSS